MNIKIISENDTILSILYSIAGMTAFITIIQQWYSSYKNSRISKDTRTINEIDFFIDNLLPIFSQIIKNFNIDSKYFIDNRNKIVKEFKISELSELKKDTNYIFKISQIMKCSEVEFNQIETYLNRLESLCFKINNNHISENLIYDMISKNIIVSTTILYPYFLWSDTNKDLKKNRPYSEIIKVYKKWNKKSENEARIIKSREIRESLQ